MNQESKQEDRLRMDYINSLPQPFVATLPGGNEWPVFDIDAETGMLRIDVSGMLEAKFIADVLSFTDASGIQHDPDTFYSDYGNRP